MNHPLIRSFPLTWHSSENTGEKKNEESVKRNHRYKWEEDSSLANIEEGRKKRKHEHVDMIDDKNEKVCQLQGSKRVLKEQSIQETRRENNRQRAKANRERVKKLTRNMEEEIGLLATSNEQLRLECQMQRKEMSMLRNICQLPALNHGKSHTHADIPSAPMTSGLRDFEILNIISKFGNTNNTITDILQAQRYSEMVGTRGTFLHPVTLTPSVYNPLT